MKVVKVLGFLLVPVAVAAAVAVGAYLFAGTVSGLPSFAGYGQYLRMLFDPDVFPVILKNLVPFLWEAVLCATVLFTLYGAVRKVFERVSDVVVYAVVFIISYLSVLNTFYVYNASFGVGGWDGYPSETIVTEPEQYYRGLTVFHFVVALFVTAVGVFVSYCLFCALVRFKVGSRLKFKRNVELGLVCSVSVLSTYVLLNLFNNRLWNVFGLVTRGASLVSALRYALNSILSVNWALFAALCLAVVVLVRIRREMLIGKGLKIALLVLSCFALVWSLQGNDAVTAALLTSKNYINLIYMNVWLLSVTSGAYLDVFGCAVLSAVALRLVVGGEITRYDGVKLLRAVSRVTVIVGCVILLLMLAAVVVSATRIADQNSGSIAIIGGADGPTARFITRKIFGQYDLPIGICLLLIAVGIAFGVAARKMFKKNPDK